MDTKKKFVLKKEALRELTEQEMTEVAGGVATTTNAVATRTSLTAATRTALTAATRTALTAATTR
ncbi:class I lanthipeptide [Sorangium sp. So ce1389]|uniref:class I lanthipeptide n=1 Tax=Sorangium sp. So ce1389 TaxID=3133336 RepID=UPI003F6059E3